MRRPAQASVPEVSTRCPHRSNRTVGAHTTILFNAQTRLPQGTESMRDPLREQAGLPGSIRSTLPSSPTSCCTHCVLISCFPQLSYHPSLPCQEFRSVFENIAFACLVRVYSAALYSTYPDPELSHVNPLLPATGLYRQGPGAYELDPMSDLR